MAATDRDHQRLQGVHPRLASCILSVLNQLPMFVVCGVRTEAEQAELYAQGRTKPGPIVTNCDGVKTRSRHQPGPDGTGRAVDCAFLGPDPFSAQHDWEGYGSRLEAAGMVWGGRFRLVDLPHAEMPYVQMGLPIPTTNELYEKGTK